MSDNAFQIDLRNRPPSRYSLYGYAVDVHFGTLKTTWVKIDDDTWARYDLAAREVEARTEQEMAHIILRELFDR